VTQWPPETLETQESPPGLHTTFVLMLPAGAHAFAASSAIVKLYVEGDPGVPAASTQSRYVPPSPVECTLHAPDVQQGVLMQVVRFDSQPAEGSVVQCP
jgi:hypothetical protein